MKSGTCPKCGSNEILAELAVRGGQGHPSYVSIAEPEPADRPLSGRQKANKASSLPMCAVDVGTRNIMRYAIRH